MPDARANILGRLRAVTPTAPPASDFSVVEKKTWSPAARLERGARRASPPAKWFFLASVAGSSLSWSS